MQPSLGTGKYPADGDQSLEFWHRPVLFRLSVLLCVLLVFLTSCVAVAHFHSNDSTADRSCALCALAHAGFAVNSLATHAPVFASSILAVIAAVSLRSYLRVFSYHIRPPPQA